MSKQRTRPETNIYNAKTHFSQLIARVEQGEEITIKRANRPVARIVPIAHGQRRRGRLRNQIVIASDFDAPVPEWETAFDTAP